MRNLVYYPYFEVQDINWLKFATLYVESLTMLIPNSGRKYLSPEFEEVITKGKFINTYSSFSSVKYSSTKTVENKLKEIMNDEFLKKHFKVEDLQRRENQTYEIFEQKFSSEWKEFILENKLGNSSLNGILVSEEVAFSYMYELATNCAIDEGKSIVTDMKNRKSMLYGMSDKTGEKKFDSKIECFTKGIIELKLPTKIDDIDMKEFIDLRNDNGFKDKQKALHDSIEAFLRSTTNESKADYLDRLKEVEKEIKIFLPAAYGVTTSLVYLIGGDEVPQYVAPLLGLIPFLFPELGPKTNNLGEVDRIKVSADKFLTNISNMRIN